MTEPRLDHIVLAAPDVDALVTSFRARAGVEPQLGGRHVGLGSRNYLVGLGGQAYLELIGPDDPIAGGTTVFGIDKLTGPRVVTWLVRSDSIEAQVEEARAAGYDPGSVSPLSRETPDGTVLRWRLTLGPPHNLDGLVPGLIDWQDSPHPTTGDLPELRLRSLTGYHPDTAAVRTALEAVGVELALRTGDPGFEVVVETPNGIITLH